MILIQEFQFLSERILKEDMQSVSVSKASVYWHLDHILKVCVRISETLTASDEKEYKKDFNLLRTFVYLLGKIPRGRGKAPKSVVAKEGIAKQNLLTQLEQAEKALQDLEKLDMKKHMKHPYFGVLNLQKSLRFLKLHTVHHIRIINEIDSSKNNNTVAK